MPNTFFLLFKIIPYFLLILLVARVFRLKDVSAEKAFVFTGLQFLAFYLFSLFSFGFASAVWFLGALLLLPLIVLGTGISAFALFLVFSRQNGKKESLAAAGVWALLSLALEFFIVLFNRAACSSMFVSSHYYYILLAMAVPSLLLLFWFLLLSKIPLRFKVVFLPILIFLCIGPVRQCPLEVAATDFETKALVPNVLLKMIPRPDFLPKDNSPRSWQNNASEWLSRRDEETVHVTGPDGKAVLGDQWRLNPFYSMDMEPARYNHYLALHQDYAEEIAPKYEVKTTWFSPGVKTKVDMRSLDMVMTRSKYPCGYLRPNDLDNMANLFPVRYLKIRKEEDPRFDEGPVLRNWFAKIDQYVPDAENRGSVKNALVIRACRELADLKDIPVRSWSEMVSYQNKVGVAQFGKEENALRDKVESVCFAKAMELTRKGLGVDQVDEASVLQNLAENALHERLEPGRLFRRALEIRERNLGPEHPQVADTLLGLALSGGSLPPPNGTEALFRRAVEIREKAFGPEHPVVADALYGFSKFYLKQKKFAEAEPLYKRAIEIREKALGPDHFSIAKMLEELGITYNNDKKYEEAASFYQKAYQIGQKNGGACIDLIGLRVHLCSLYRQIGRTAEAEEIERSVYGRPLTPPSAQTAKEQKLK